MEQLYRTPTYLVAAQAFYLSCPAHPMILTVLRLPSPGLSAAERQVDATTSIACTIGCMMNNHLPNKRICYHLSRVTRLVGFGKESEHQNPSNDIFGAPPRRSSISPTRPRLSSQYTVVLVQMRGPLNESLDKALTAPKSHGS